MFTKTSGYLIMAAVLILAICVQQPIFNVHAAEPLSPTQLGMRSEFAAIFAAPPVAPVEPQQSSFTAYTAFDAAFAVPALAVGTVTASSVTYTAGVISANGTATTITAGTVTSLTASKTDCSPAGIIAGSCDIIYWPGSGASLSFTTSLQTAIAYGNVIVGYATESSVGVVTAVKPASMDLPATNGYVYNCGSTGTCAQTAQADITVVGTGLALSSGTATVTGLPSLTYDSCAVSSTITTAGNLATARCTVTGTTLTILIANGGTLNVSYELKGH